MEDDLTQDVNIEENEVLLDEDVSQTTDLFSIYVKQGLKSPLLKHSELVVLVEKAQEGCVISRNTIIESNQRLIVNIAKNFPDKSVPMLDLVSEGNFGLIRAIEKFEVDKGYQFSTYASIWIRQSMQALIMNMKRTVRWPSHFISMTNKYNRLIEREKLKGLTPTPDMIKDELEINQQAFELLTSTTSYMVPIDTMKYEGEDGGGVAIVDTLVDDEADLSLDLIENEQRGQCINELINLHLDKRAANIVKMRFGLGAQEMALEQVSDVYNITRERVRQIEYQSLLKLRRMLAFRHEIADSSEV